MIYRERRKIAEPVSLLSLGCMRFPVINGDRANIDKNQVFKMLDYACEEGVTYFDTTYLYHKGLSETVLGEYFAKQKRNSILIATKLPWWLCKSKEDCCHYFQIQMERLKLDCVDVYLLQGLNKKGWDNIKDSYIIDFLLYLKKKGKIRYIGFSFHDTYEVFCEILSYGLWDLCQVQMNVADMFSQATVEGLKLAYEAGVDVLIMEPLRGGKLVNNVPALIQEKYFELGKNYSVAEWCFRWLYDSPYITSILSGMSDLIQLQDNIRIFQNAKADCLTDFERKQFKEICNLYNAIEGIACTGCGYCMDCARGLNIPQVIDTFNSIISTDNQFINKLKYKRLTSGKNDIRKCIECGSCAKRCPQNIPIDQVMHNIKDYLEFHYGHL